MQRVYLLHTVRSLKNHNMTPQNGFNSDPLRNSAKFFMELSCPKACLNNLPC